MTAQLSFDLNTAIAWLVAHGLPPAFADDLRLMEGRAKDVVWMVITDGTAAAQAFIAAEKAKILAALQTAPTQPV